MEGLNLDNILDDDAVDLFNSDNDDEQEETQEETPDKEETQEPAEINPDDLFDGEDKSESVSSDDEDNEEQENTSSKDGNSSSPNIFSSIAEAFAEEGILPNLDDDKIKDIKSAEDFRDAINEYIQSELNETQKRINDALSNNVPNDTIRQYEYTINYLSKIDEEALSAESEEAEDMRKKIIYQDYINRGFDPKRAEKEVNKSIQGGTDVDDAKEALQGCISYYKGEYSNIIESAKAANKQAKQDQEKAINEVKNEIMSKKNKFFDLDIDKSTRQKIFDNISKPVYKDPDTGEVFTAIQKYQRENNQDFLVKLGLLFTLTDGFKSLDKLIGGNVKKGVKKGLKDLESRIKSSNTTFGDLKFAAGVDDQSYIGKGLKLDF